MTKTSMRIAACAAIMVAATAAQGEPKGKETRDPPRLPLYSGPDPALTAKERKGVSFGKEWAGNRDTPARGDDGGIVFVFGSTLPTIVCAPLYVCDLALQDGENVNDLNVGDGVRWKITPASQGAGEAIITHVMIKPTDVGLTTNLVITTNRRTYTVKLVSREKDWMPRAAFEYPDEPQAQWRAYRVRQDQKREMAAAFEPRPPIRRDIVFTISGDSPAWRPLRVTSDGVKTYIQLPADSAHGDLPALIALAEDKSFLSFDSLFNGPTPQLVNYRFVAGRFEVDKVLDRAQLISGVGRDQTQVTITREP